jgi:ribosomal protein S27AE
MAGICPFCGRGPFQVLAGHTQKVHGVDRFELRELADLTYSTSILDERTREAFSARAKARLAAGIPLPTNDGARKKRRLSPAGKRIAAEKLLRFAEQLGPEGLSRQRTAAARLSGELRRKPHPCPACGTILPTAHPITCSPACRRLIRVRTALASAEKRVGGRR